MMDCFMECQARRSEVDLLLNTSDRWKWWKMVASAPRWALHVIKMSDLLNIERFKPENTYADAYIII